MDDFSFDLGAASWRHSHADEKAYVEALVERLEKSIPDLVRVKREHKWFSKVQSIHELEILMDENTFTLTLENDRFIPRVAKAVRGIVLSHKNVAMQEWLSELSGSLSEVARVNHEMRKSLEDFLL